MLAPRRTPGAFWKLKQAYFFSLLVRCLGSDCQVIAEFSWHVKQRLLIYLTVVSDFFKKYIAQSYFKITFFFFLWYNDILRL